MVPKSNAKILTLDFLRDVRPSMRDVVHCHGVFDVLHIGHLNYLKAARAMGQHLIVTITSDQYVNKGPGRPHFSAAVRAQMLAALDCVDYVAISDFASAVRAIEEIRPEFYVKGSDYRDMSADASGQIYAEKSVVEKYGGKLVFTDTEMHSSSALINSCLNPWSEEQRRAIDEVNKLGGLTEIERLLAQIKKEVSVALLGELIWDIYRYVRPEGLSSKSPSLSARFVREECSQGGAWAITRHIEDFCKVSLVTSGVKHEKIRYISSETGQRLFEVTHILAEREMPSPWPEHNLQIVADFGHGLITKHNSISDGAFRALNVQTNSSNYGFNVFTKHSRFDYLVTDLRELRLAYNDRDSSALLLLKRVAHESNAPAPVAVAVTLGPDGSAFYQNGQIFTCPAFTDKVLDATGAGDAYLAITSLFVKAGAHPIITNFVGNVFAGLKTKINGNTASVTKAQLLSSCAAILK